MQSIDQFRVLLAEARLRIPHGAAFGARLGLALRSIDPAFAPSRFGAKRLVDLLRQVPDVGTVGRTASDYTFTFLGDEAAATSEHGAGTSASSPLPRVRSALWQLVTAFYPPAGGWSIDLETLKVVSSDNDPDGILKRTPERAVSLPNAGLHFHRTLVAEFLAQERPELLERLAGFPESGPWMREVTDMLRSEGLAEKWFDFRNRKIVDLVLAWADQHGLPRNRIVEPPKVSRHHVAVRGSHEASSRAPGSLRETLHRLVDAMSEQELARLHIEAGVIARVFGPHQAESYRGAPSIPMTSASPALDGSAERTDLTEVDMSGDSSDVATPG
jgi:hypothetical protein